MCNDSFTSEVDFAQWFSDSTPAIKRQLEFVNDGADVFSFVASQYFPLDGIGCRDLNGAGRNYVSNDDTVLKPKDANWMRRVPSQIQPRMLNVI